MSIKLIPLLGLFAIATVGCMSVPHGVHLYTSLSGCTSTGVCPWTDGKVHAYYFAPTRELVVPPMDALPPATALKIEAHELCHSHQHETILEETSAEPRDLTLHEWISTSEGIAYQAVVEAHPRPAEWNLSIDNTLEDFAEACARYLTDYQQQEPARDQFFAERGFK